MSENLELTQSRYPEREAEEINLKLKRGGFDSEEIYSGITCIKFSNKHICEFWLCLFCSEEVQ